MVASTDMNRDMAGHAMLEVKQVAGESTVTSTIATSPLKLLIPRARGQSVWAFASSFGGGLVAGDQTRLDLCVGAGARCFVGTQASTKIYRNPSCRPCGHVTQATLEAGSLLVFGPDPVQPFAHSIYTQRQQFHLGPDAGLVLVDWFCSGRTARGERWVFNRLQSRNEVWSSNNVGQASSLPVREASCLAQDGGKMPRQPAAKTSAPHIQTGSHSSASARPARSEKRVFLDSLLLDPAHGPLDAPHRTGRFNCFALLLVLGAPVRGAAAQILETISGQPVTRGGSLLRSASPVQDGAILRVAGERMEEVARELHRHFGAVAELLGDDPWSRKW